MADIATYPFVRHLRGTPTTWVRHIRRGSDAHVGVGQSFWFRPLSAVLSEVPVDDRELPMLFHARTADFQDVSIQATVTYRVADPLTASMRMDFSIEPETGTWRSDPLEQLAAVISETAQQIALDVLGRTPVAEVLAGGVGPLRDAVDRGLSGHPRLAGSGVEVLEVRVVAIRPDGDLEKALQTPVRESVAQQADRATFERRALAVERERAIGENELQTRIELARREEQLVTQQGANARRAAEDAAASDRITVEAEAARAERMATATAEVTRLTGAAEGEAERARMDAVADVPQQVLLALALRELAARLPQVEHLVLTPDLLSPVLSRLGSDAGSAAGSTADGAAAPEAQR